VSCARATGQALVRLTALIATLLIAAALSPAFAQPAAEKPRHLQLLEKQYRSGDWILQCDSWVSCRILGIVEARENKAELRPIIMIDRSWQSDARIRIQIAFIDGYGQISDTDQHGRWRMVVGGNPRQPFEFVLSTPNSDRAHPVPPEFVDGLIERLQQPRREPLNRGDRPLMRVPRGDLAGLLRRMDRLQHPSVDPVTPAQRSLWLKQYRYTVMRGQPVAGVAPPDQVVLTCNTRTQARYVDGWRLDPNHLFWIAHCPEGSKMFLHKPPAEPIPFNLSRFGGGLELDVFSRFDPDTSLLTVKLSEKKRGDCGHRVRFGWTTTQNFGMIEHRKLDLCRHVPANFWPLTWSPTSWRYDGEPPASTGDAPQPNEQVNSPKSSN
jgi:hypothetical protein